MNNDQETIKDAQIEKGSVEIFDYKSNKKYQNVLSVAILLGGLFAGSLFVDIAQLVVGNGFSEKVIKNSNILSAGDKTWVAYEEPLVHVQVLTDASCEKCSPEQALVWLRRIIPTVVATPVEYSSAEGAKLAANAGVISLPAFVFDKETEKLSMFAQLESLFIKKDDNTFVLNTEQIGMPSGKLLALPEVGDTDFQVGPKDAKVTVIEYADFECPYCRILQPAINQMLSEYKDKIRYVYKHYPLSIHPQANNAALATECANEQGKFMAYGENLYAKQADWSKTQGTQSFKNYAAALGLKTAQFNKCLDDKKYQDKINASLEEGAKFGVSGTPRTFINDQFVNGAVSYDELKKAIDDQLAK